MSGILSLQVAIGAANTSPSPAVQQFFNRLATLPSTPRQALYSALIDGLNSDGVWSKLDCLIVPGADSATNLVNLVQSAFSGVLIGSPTFTADSGYSGLNGVNYIDTGFNPSVVSGGSYNFKQNTASFGAWNIDTTIGNGYTLRSNPNAGNVVELIPYYSGTSAMGINSVEANSGTVVDPAGFYVAVRTASNAVSMDKNGTNINTNTTASGTPENNNILVGYSAGSTSWKVGMWFFGGSLTSGDRANIYTRVYNYMHAIGAV